MSLSIQGYPFLASPILSSIGPESLMLRDAGSVASIAWATANQARYVPFWIPERIVVVKLLAYNGATLGGNTDIGIYDEVGSEVVGIGAAAQTPTNNWQEFDITDTPLNPGLYFVGLLNTTTTATYFGWANKEIGRAMGVYSQAVGAATLPTPTATFAALDAAVIPIVGMATRTLI